MRLYHPDYNFKSKLFGAQAQAAGVAMNAAAEAHVLKMYNKAQAEFDLLNTELCQTESEHSGEEEEEEEVVEEEEEVPEEKEDVLELAGVDDEEASEEENPKPRRTRQEKKVKKEEEIEEELPVTIEVPKKSVEEFPVTIEVLKKLLEDSWKTVQLIPKQEEPLDPFGLLSKEICLTKEDNYVCTRPYT